MIINFIQLWLVSIQAEPLTKNLFFQELGLVFEYLPPTQIMVEVAENDLLLTMHYKIPFYNETLFKSLQNCGEESFDGEAFNRQAKTLVHEKLTQIFGSNFQDFPDDKNENKDVEIIHINDPSCHRPVLEDHVRWMRFDKNTCLLVPLHQPEKLLLNFAECKKYCNRNAALIATAGNGLTPVISNVIKMAGTKGAWVNNLQLGNTTKRPTEAYRVTSIGTIETASKTNSKSNLCLCQIQQTAAVQILPPPPPPFPSPNTTTKPNKTSRSFMPPPLPTDIPTTIESAPEEIPIKNIIIANKHGSPITNYTNLDSDKPQCNSNLYCMCDYSQLNKKFYWQLIVSADSSSKTTQTNHIRMIMLEFENINGGNPTILADSMRSLGYNASIAVNSTGGWYGNQTYDLLLESYRTMAINDFVYAFLTFKSEPVKGKLVDQIATIKLLSNTTICNDLKLSKIEFVTKSLENMHDVPQPSPPSRKRRHVGIFKYWLKGGGILPSNLNAEIDKLRRLEDHQIEELRHSVLSKRAGHALVDNMKKIDNKLSTQICHESVSNKAAMMSYHLNTLIREVLQDIRLDVESCMNTKLPITLPMAEIQRICQASNRESHACLNLNLIDKIFSCQLRTYQVAKDSLSDISVQVKLTIMQLDVSPTDAYVIKSVGVPLRTGLPTLDPKPVKNNTQTGLSPREYLETLWSRKRRSPPSYYYRAIKDLPQILLRHHSTNALTTLTGCENFGRIFKCSAMANRPHGACAANVFRADPVKIKEFCHSTVFSGPSCITASTPGGNLMLATHKKIEIFNIQNTPSIFTNEADTACTDTCYITQDKRLRCGEEITLNKNLKSTSYETKEISSVVTISELPRSVMGNEDLYKKLNTIVEMSTIHRGRIDDISEHKIIGNVLKINDKHWGRAQFVILMIITVLMTVTLFGIAFYIYIVFQRKRRQEAYSNAYERANLTSDIAGNTAKLNKKSSFERHPKRRSAVELLCLILAETFLPCCLRR